ncbi:MAG: site-specific integrase [Betaproteobacteria bacterium]|nr:site-specific integrase [Betaproteobacteria bacterium]
MPSYSATAARRTFREATIRYLSEARKRSLDDDALHIRQLDPFIGDLLLRQIHDGSLASFKQQRLLVDKVSQTTVKRSLEVVRHILRLAENWRDEYGLTWLERAPRITMPTQAELCSRQPYPLAWDEQQLLFGLLPKRLADMALFKVNTGCREQEVCSLRWRWEQPVPELETTVFVVPGDRVKNGRPRLIVLNTVAQAVVDAYRGQHPEFVFHRQGQRLMSMNNNGWQRARERAADAYQEKFDRPAPDGFRRIRVHDLKHTFGRRLRAAGVGFETRQALLGHHNGSVTTHYSAAEMAELLEAVNRINTTRNTPAMTLLRAVA